MDFFQSQNQQKYHPSKQQNSNNKKRLTQDQVRLLERTFTTNKKLEPELKLQLASQLRVPPRQVAIWYQNKRARWKTQSLELDYNTLQVKLENALADRRRLERQVVQLQEELRKTHHTCMLFANLNHRQLQGPAAALHQPADPIINNVSNCNSSCDEGAASSSLHEEVNGEVLQFDHDLYAYLYGAAAAGTWDN